MTAASDIVLERVMRLHPKIIDLELTRVERLLNLVGNPERNLPPVVHVAGTNGKGSVIAYLRAMLEAAGKRVHVYTSPHLVRFHERIRLAGELIEEQALVDLIEECERANGGDPITFFEITTVAAFLAFSRVKADILLLETGLGGEFDATNVIDAPRATIITPISFDHMQFLGNSLAKIAAAKAGILKPGRPAIIAQQPPEAAAVIDARAAALRAPLWRCGSEWNFEIGERGFTYRDSHGAIALPKPVLPGRHQFGNAATAVAATRWLEDFALSEHAMAAGLANAVWPARMQRLSRGPLVDLLPPGWELWLDGGHNADAGQIIADMIGEWQQQERKPVSLIFGMLTSKDPLAFLRPLAPLAEDLSAVAIPGDHSSLSAADAVSFAGQAGLPAAGYESIAAALAAIIERHGLAPRRVLICGSLYLAGTVLAENG
ncbi:bifunctional folylpolyglutamate synthase/dihydrofolate synthase [Dongia deserti]|uniref:bifunctional folylpolyglutamate synthase/dihydrofolate synthase n=1 Tax=Dongia deserti TaxID=2268030 RepID=UPI000E6545EC|nr:folylpolyglutamate synthase/dihydrofolate synthase family protein [Dongia deserti]